MKTLDSTRKKYLDIINQTRGIFADQDISQENIESLKKSEATVRTYETLIPVCGGFNAGKTSLINAFLDTAHLPVDILPETAIAAEIRQGAPECVKAVKVDGVKDSYTLEEIKQISIDKYEHIEVVLDSDSLGKLGEVILVDMPGIDSSLENHNKAILSYLTKGSHYIFVIDVEDGTLKKTSFDFLKEIKSYEKSFSVIINKSDRKPDSIINDVRKQVETIVGSIVSDNTIKVGVCSAQENEINDFVEAVLSFDSQGVFKKNSSNVIIPVINSAISELDIRFNSLDVSASDLDKTIRKLSQSREEVERKLKIEAKKIEAELSSTALEEILSMIKQGLRAESYYLATTLINSGKEAFNAQLNEILRPILVNSTKKSIERISETLITDISKAFANLTKLEISDKAKINHTSTSTLLPAVSNAFTASKSGFNDFAKIVKGKDFNLSYKGMSGVLAIATGIIAPWLEIIILFLPEIIGLLGSIFGDSAEDKIKKLEVRISSEVVPMIASKLRPEVEKSLKETQEELFLNLNESFNREVMKIESALITAKNSKSGKIDEMESRKNSIKNSIESLLKIRREIETILLEEV